MDLHYSNSERPAKRTRQACKPCRRKKSKCNGEKPSCSLCRRLRQECYYAPDAQIMDIEEPDEPGPRTRMESLENTLAEVLNSLKGGGHQTQPSVRSSEGRQPSCPDDVSIRPPSPVPAPRHSSSTQLLTTALPPWEVMLILADDYLRYCDCQPLPVFYRETFCSTFPDRDPEVVYSVLALTMRYSDNPWARRNAARDCVKYRQAAHQIVLSRVLEGRVELSTIQALCLLSLIEFYDGNSARSMIHSSLAMTLTRCAQLHRESSKLTNGPAVEERRRCYWSIALLRRLHGEPVHPPHSLAPPPYPDTPTAPPLTAMSPEGHRVASHSTLSTGGIMTTVIQLSEVWSIAQEYARARGGSEDNVVIWSPLSKYSTTLQKLMNLGQKLPALHRYRCVQLPSVSAEDLERSRDFWAPWFLSRFLYHTSICVLNHPLLITLQLQGVRGVPEIFLQQTAFSVSHHTSWMLHFIDFLQSTQFRVSDPFLGQCAAVVATIELQQSFSEENDIAQKRRNNFEICLKFVEGLASDWPHIQQLVKKLRDLKIQVSQSRESSLNNFDGTITIDISGFLDILDLTHSSRMRGEEPVSNTLFGPGLSLDNPHSERTNPTNLHPLPPITTIETTSQAGESHRNQSMLDSEDSRGLFNQGSNDLEPVIGDLALPAVQFFNAGQLQAVTDWWDDAFGDPIGGFTQNGPSGRLDEV
ncbi:hypothetical protein GQ53DRAFT_721685 [Thozetella sp. PMI_491]|nr:hypothetical protein GQ53DRAFT_721685 [Thozetella sp. PMI_491]